MICPKIKMQFHKISQFPKDKNENLMLKTFATDEIGDTPSSPLFVTATPSAEKNRLIINKMQRLVNSFLLMTTSLVSFFK